MYFIIRWIAFIVAFGIFFILIQAVLQQLEYEDSATLSLIISLVVAFLLYSFYAMFMPKKKEKPVVVKENKPVEPVVNRIETTPSTIYVFRDTMLIAPFKKIPEGYYRLFIILWIVVPILSEVISSTYDDYDDREFAAFFIATIVYYILAIFSLWVYLGFKEKK